MNHPSPLGKTTAPTGVFPGVAPIKTGAVGSRLGSVEVKPPSAPRRLLDKLLTGLHLRSKTPPQPASPPLPLKGPQLQPLLRGAATFAHQLGVIGDDHPSAWLSMDKLAEHVVDILEQVRQGAATPNLTPAMKSALALGNLPAFVNGLQQAIAATADPTQLHHVNNILQAHLGELVLRDIQAHGPLTSGVHAPPAPALTQSPLTDKLGQPLVRLQALGVPADQMKPMERTLEDISDALFQGNGPRAEQLLDKLMDQLREHLKLMPDAVKQAFVYSDGKAFVADLRDAILGQTHGDTERLKVTTELDGFSQQWLHDAFDVLVKDIVPSVDPSGLPHMPAQANVGALAIQRMESALQELQSLRANPGGDPTGDLTLQARAKVQKCMTELLDLVRSGAALPGLSPGLRAAALGGDMAAFVNTLRSEVLARASDDQRNAIAYSFDHLAVPASHDDEAAHGALKVNDTTPKPLAKPTFDKPLLPTARLDALASTPQQRQQLEAVLARVGQAMALGDPVAIRNQLAALNQQLRPLLAQQEASLRLGFSLSDGHAFVADLAQAILTQTPASQRDVVNTQLQLFMRPQLQQAFTELVAQSLDSARLSSVLADEAPAQVDIDGTTWLRLQATPDASDELGTSWTYVDASNPARQARINLPPREITVQGRTYVRDKAEALGSGQFGEVWSYTELQPPGTKAPPPDRVVMKVPKPGGLAPGSAEAPQVMIHAPLREGRATVQGMGTGGGDLNNAKLVGVIRGSGSVNLVMRLETGGSLIGHMPTLHSAPTTPELMKGKLALLSDMTAALHRLHAAKGVAHIDIALRNVLIDAKGRAVLNDYGIASVMPDGGSVQGAQAPILPGMLPTTWIAPEALTSGQITEKAEVFSLGVAFLEMAFGLDQRRPPWSPGLNRTDIQDMRMNGHWDAAAMVARLGPLSTTAWPDATVRQQLLDLITRMIDNDPAQRPTLAEVAASPLFQSLGEADRQALVTLLMPPPPPAPDPAAVVPVPQPVVHDINYGVRASSPAASSYGDINYSNNA